MCVKTQLLDCFITSTVGPRADHSGPVGKVAGGAWVTDVGRLGVGPGQQAAPGSAVVSSHPHPPGGFMGVPDCGVRGQVPRPRLRASGPGAAVSLRSDRRPVGRARARGPRGDGRAGARHGATHVSRPAGDAGRGRLRDPLRSRVAGAAGGLPAGRGRVRVLRAVERAGLPQRLVDALRARIRIGCGRAAPPTAGSIDSRA